MPSSEWTLLITVKGTQLWPSPFTNTKVVDAKSARALFSRDTPEPSSAEMVFSSRAPCSVAHSSGPGGMDHISRIVIAEADAYANRRTEIRRNKLALKIRNVPPSASSNRSVHDVPKK